LETFILQIINALILSCTYALIAVGFSLFFGAFNVINFAHGDVCIAGVFLTLVFYSFAKFFEVSSPVVTIGLDLVIMVIGILGTGMLGIIIERGVIRPFRKANILIVLVATVALGIIIRECIKNFYPAGGLPHAFPKMLPEGGLALGGITLRYENMIIFFGSLVLITCVFLFINYTRFGLSIRAMSQDREAAMMMGMSSNRTAGIVFFLGSGLGAVAGIINALYFGATRFDLGLLFGIKGFSVSVVGGLGNVYGAVIGGILFGLIETFAIAFIPEGTAWKEFVAFFIVIVFLIFRPNGILGEKVFEKV
jgi:branched-chain amino acid transport system permease protein